MIEGNYLNETVRFEDSGHRYWNPRTGKRYLSVTTLKKEYVPEFPAEYMSIFKAVEFLCGGKYTEEFQRFKSVRDVFGADAKGDKNEKYRVGALHYLNHNNAFSKSEILQKAQEFLDEWEKKSDDGKANGTKVHKKEEDKVHDTKRTYYHNKYIKLSPYYHNGLDRPVLNSDLPDGLYSELLMALHFFELAGQADTVIIETIDGVRYVDIDDFKTDKEIKRHNHFDTLKKPLQHLSSCNFNEYALQLSMYMYMCECYGFVPRKIGITHMREEIKAFEVPYLRKEVIKLLEIRKQQLNLEAI